MLLPKIKKIPKNTNGRLAIPALAGLLVFTLSDSGMAVLARPVIMQLRSDTALSLCGVQKMMATDFDGLRALPL